jgi:hypothetical protein
MTGDAWLQEIAGERVRVVESTQGDVLNGCIAHSLDSPQLQKQIIG